MTTAAALSSAPSAFRPRQDAYGRFVAFIKLLLPTLAILLIGVVFAWPQIAERAERFRLTFADIDPTQADLTSIVNARYLGVDSKDQTYTLTADLAKELGPAKDLVHLIEPKGDQIRTDGKWVSLEGNIGYYTKSKELLDLSGDVILYRDDGFQFHTETARMFLEKDEAVGSDEVRGFGPSGEVISEGFQINDGGEVILFSNQAWLHLYNGGEERPPGEVMMIPARPGDPPVPAPLPLLSDTSAPFTASRDGLPNRTNPTKADAQLIPGPAQDPAPEDISDTAIPETTSETPAITIPVLSGRPVPPPKRDVMP